MHAAINPPGDDRANEKPGVDEGRRRWTRAGVGAGVVIATLAGRPAFAGVCQSPSAFSSGNMSNHGPTQSCAGYPPELWRDTNLRGWPVENVAFHSIFSSGSNAHWGDKTLLDVLQGVTTGAPGPFPNPISQEFVAAYLNIKRNFYPAGLDETRLIMMWNEFVGSGQYEVRAGVFWNAAKIVNYLQYMRTN
jgi:hypothetical protein